VCWGGRGIQTVADYFLQMIKDQFDTLYRAGAENERVKCLSLHPHNIGRPNAAKYLDQALQYILGYHGVWNTTAGTVNLVERAELAPTHRGE
jgi:hypothetical protein